MRTQALLNELFHVELRASIEPFGQITEFEHPNTQNNSIADGGELTAVLLPLQSVEVRI
jgi:hypothetical protein